MGKLILRVDDIGWLPPDKTKDVGLRYFQLWREKMGLHGLPVYYGMIPSMIGQPELDWIRANLCGKEELAVHGKTHMKGEKVTAAEMSVARDVLDSYHRCRSYIAPFNEYDQGDIEAWGSVQKQGFFFGGFHGDNHKQGYLPVYKDSCYHLPAFRPTYDHTEVLLKQLPRWLDLDCPLVVTLHATWGWKALELLPQLADMIRPHLVSVDFVRSWYEAQELNKQQLTAPHYLAYKSVIERLTCPHSVGSSVIDFGSRYSALPSQLALRGFRVIAVDRDTMLGAYQKEVTARYGVSTVKTVVGETVIGAFGREQYDYITSCWALQHNPPMVMAGIARAMAKALKVNGKLVVVSSFTPGSTFEQRDRPDPQTVLNWIDHHKYIVGPSGLEVTWRQPFHYEHGSTIGDYCDQDQANAICYELVKR